MRFGQDVAVVGLMIRCQVLWLLGYPDAALADAERALKKAREIGHAATLLYALSYIPSAYVDSGKLILCKTSVIYERYRERQAALLGDRDEIAKVP
jgi:hypothetical protein